MLKRGTRKLLGISKLRRAYIEGGIIKPYQPKFFTARQEQARSLKSSRRVLGGKAVRQRIKKVNDPSKSGG